MSLISSAITLSSMVTMWGNLVEGLRKWLPVSATYWLRDLKIINELHSAWFHLLSGHCQGICLLGLLWGRNQLSTSRATLGVDSKRVSAQIWSQKAVSPKWPLAHSSVACLPCPNSPFLLPKFCSQAKKGGWGMRLWKKKSKNIECAFEESHCPYPTWFSVWGE